MHPVFQGVEHNTLVVRRHSMPLGQMILYFEHYLYDEDLVAEETFTGQG